MPVRVGIVGVGYWGPNLVRCFSQLDSCELTYCCDKDPHQLLKIKKQFPTIVCTQDFNVLLNDKSVTAIVIATPSDTHTEFSEKSLHAGKHILVEKPLTLSVDEASKLVRLSNEKKLILMVGHTYEYHPAIVEIKEYIDKAVIGKPYYIYSMRVNLGKVREETNALWNLAPHDVSILNYWLDTPPESVMAIGRAYLQLKHEDVVFMSLKYSPSVLAHIQVSWLNPRKERKMTIIGSKKMIVFDDLDNEAKIKMYDKGFIKLTNKKGERIYKEFSLRLRPGDIHMPYIEPKEPLKEECRHFIECVIRKKTPRTDGQNGLAVVKTLEAAQKSLDNNGIWVDIN